jgi:hypothetical protein
VQIDQQNDDLGSFIFRTTGFNSIRTLSARLHYLSALSGGLLASLPLRLCLRAKTTIMSHRTPVYYVDITLRQDMSLEQTLEQAQALDTQRRTQGFDQEALDRAAQEGFANGLFEETEDELPAVLDEFYPDLADESSVESPLTQENMNSLQQKIARKANQQASRAMSPNLSTPSNPVSSLH